MNERSMTLQYKKTPLRIALEADGAWIPAEDVGVAIGLKDPKGPVTRIPEHERSLRQIGGQGVRMRVLSVEGVQRIAGSVRAPGALPFLDWFRAQAMPEIALALQEVSGGGASVPAAADAAVTTDLSLDTGRSFLYDHLPVRLQIDAEGEILFRADDVCQALELGNPRQAIDSHVDPDDVQKLDTIDSMGRSQQVNYVNLSGLYALVFGSKKDAARRFKRWVTHDVLPSIQKTGRYSLADDDTGSVLTSSTGTAAERLAQTANLAALSASLPCGEQSLRVQMQARHGLTYIHDASQALRGMRVDIGFQHGLERPVVAAALPEALAAGSPKRAAAGKVLAGRVYVLEFGGNLDRPRVRPLQFGEHLVKASVDGVKFLANHSQFGLDAWSQIEEWSRKKVQAEKNRA